MKRNSGGLHERDATIRHGRPWWRTIARAGVLGGRAAAGAVVGGDCAVWDDLWRDGDGVRSGAVARAGDEFAGVRGEFANCAVPVAGGECSVDGDFSHGGGHQSAPCALQRVARAGAEIAALVVEGDAVLFSH